MAETKPLERPIQSIDILPQIEKFPVHQRQFLLKNTVAIEMTRGCSSGCPDCAAGAKKGVEAKIDFDSFERFMATYNEELPDNFALHYASEPFDYQDRDRGISDIYKTIKKHKPKTRIYISTYFPEGSDLEMGKLVTEMIRSSVDNNLLPETLRISIRQSKLGARRKERQKILERLTSVKTIVDANLIEDKYKKQVETFFTDNIDGQGFGGLTVSSSDKERQPLNKSMEKSSQSDDTMQTGIPIAPSDGVILGPDGFRGLVMDALSVINPTGQTQWPIEPGEAFEAPLKQADYYATEFGNVYSYYLNYRGNFPEVLIPTMKIGVNSSEDERIIPKERVTLSREIRSLRTMLQTFRMSADYLKKTDDDFLVKLYIKIRQEYAERRHGIVAVLEGGIPEGQAFYVEPAQLYLKLMDQIIEDVDTKLREKQIDGAGIVDVFSYAATLKSQQIREMK